MPYLPRGVARGGACATLSVDGDAYPASTTLACATCTGRVRRRELCDDRDRDLPLALIGHGRFHPR